MVTENTISNKGIMNKILFTDIFLLPPIVNITMRIIPKNSAAKSAIQK